MTAVWFRFGAELRTRWRTALGLALLVGLAGGIVLTAVAGARRTDSAYPRMLDATTAWDVTVNPDHGTDSELNGKADEVRALPQVERFGRIDGMVLLPATTKRVEDFFDTVDLAPTDARMFHDYFRPNVLEGRLSDPGKADEVMIESRYAELFDLRVGERFSATTFAFEELLARYPGEREAFAAVQRGDFGKRGRYLVTGIVTLPDLLAVDEGFQNGYALLTPAFLRKYPEAKAGFFGYEVQLRRGAADEPAFRKAVEALAPGETIEFQSRALIDETVDRAVRPYTVALWAFALAVAFTGLLVIGQAMTRQRYLDAVDDPSLAAIGCSRSQLLVLALLRAVLVAVPGALFAVAFAYLASPLMPIGPAAQAEVHPGLSFDAVALGLGALSLAVVVLALALLAARRLVLHSRAGAGSGERVPVVSAALARSGVYPVPSIGVRFAVESGRGRTAVPARTTLVTAVLAVATVLAAFTFAAGLDRLLSTPRLFGVTWQLQVTSESEENAAAAQQLGRVLQRTPGVEGWSLLHASRVELDGRNVPAAAFERLRGDVAPTVASGREPTAPNEVALGRRTLVDLGVGIGDTVTARYLDRSRPLTVVGRVVLPGLGNYPGGDKTSPGDGAMLTPVGLGRLGPEFSNQQFPVRVRAGSDVAAVRARLERRFADGEFLVEGVQRPADVVDLRRVRATPVVLALMLALLGAATIANALVATIRRRRRDLALLKTLGFTRGQISGAIAWQASTIAVIAVLVGAPLGIAAGRLAWSVLASSIGFLSEPAVGWLAVGLALPVLLVGANLVAAVPAWFAGRTRPAAVLRAE